MHDWYATTSPHTMGAHRTVVKDDGDGPVVLCLHGFPTSSWDFEPLWPQLTNTYRAISFDLIGLGMASKPDAPIPVGLQADVALSILAERGITEAHLFAHDLGATVGQELLARQVDGISSVTWRSAVMLNGGLFPESHHPRLIQRLLMSPLGGWVAKLSTERTFRRNMTRIFGPDTPPSDAFLQHGWTLLERDGGRAALPHLIRYMAERRVHRDRWVGALTDAGVPMRLINGSKDPVSGRHLAERYAEVISDADVVHLPTLGHYPHVEDPQAVLEPTLSFLQQHDGGAASQ